jgi:protein-S-isoprenylcysteine O-methyltransferase Ste14
LALVFYSFYLLFALLGRSWLQRRRTGDWGFRGLSGSVFSADGIGGALLVAGMAASGLAPVLALAGIAPLVFEHQVLHILGFGMLGPGFVYTLVAQLQLGASWRIGVDLGERTALVTHGLFARVRNPIFTGMLLASFGLALAVPNAPALAGAVLTLLGLEIHVRLVEEPYLLRAHGEAYRAYARRVGRFAPGVGRLA